jgi:predicted RNA-binding protein with RPS1 domain
MQNHTKETGNLRTMRQWGAFVQPNFTVEKQELLHILSVCL